MQHAILFVPVFGIGLLVTAAGCSSCTSSSSPAGTGGHFDAGVGGHGGGHTMTGSGGAKTTASGGSGSSSSSTTELPDGGVPCSGWPGWRQFTEVGVNTPVCVPMSKGALPEPFAWDPCAPEGGFAAGCRQLRIPFPWTFRPIDVATVDLASQPPLLSVLQRATTYKMLVAGEVDGPMRTAILDRESGGAQVVWGGYYSQGLRHGKFITDISENQSPTDGYAAGSDLTAPDPIPRLLWTWPQSEGHAVGTGKAIWGTYALTEIGMAPWGKPWQVVYSGVPTGRQQGFSYYWNDFVVWNDGNFPYSSDFRAYTPAKGVYSFISYNNDSTQGVMGFGTDGKQMVWVHGHDRKPADQGYPVQDIMVSPFTTDPAKIQAKRVRSHPSKWSLVVPYAVGCGYAAYGPEIGQVFVVRLSDGWTWNLSQPGCQFPDLTKGFCLYDVLGINCDEVFVNQVARPQTVARIRLDALGPGQAGD